MSHQEFDNAEAALDHFYERSAKDPTLDFEEYCRVHARWADEMRRERAQLERVRSLLQKMAPGQGSQAVAASGPEAKLGPTLQGTLEQLNGKSGTPKRYEVRGEIGHGGMGVVYRARDTVLERDVAMKVIRANRSGSATVGRQVLEPRSIGRFVEEAQITAQLDHPSIVPIYDLGYDEHGDLYFTMRLVEGRTFAQIIDLVAARDERWNTTRAVDVLARVCEALAFAHTKDVIHRDLKPSNVMVGDFGAVYVMDWGLARILDELRTEQPATNGAAKSPAQGVKSARRIDGSGSGLLTQIGDVVGTPAFMPLEQANGKPEDIGPLCDVYAAGAMLYALLVGRPPYTHPGETPASRVVLARLLADPPAAVEFAAPSDTPPELIAICEKAMARYARDRYASALDLAADLRAYLEGRVVRAHRVDLLTFARKWVVRNRALSAGVAGTLAVVIGGTIWFVNRLSTEVRNKNVALVDLQVTTHERDRVNHRLRAEDLIARAEDLFPANAAHVHAMDAWLVEVDELLRNRDPYVAEQTQASADVSAQVKLDLDQVVAALGTLDTARKAVAARRTRAESYERRSIGDHVDDWKRAIEAIADNESYKSADREPLHIQPQLGLVPLRENPNTQLWEFWVLDTGDPPVDANPRTGEFEIGPRTAIVLVLIPGAAQHTPPIEPFFIGKYEVTQGQWRTVTGVNPAHMSLDRRALLSSKNAFDDRYPVETITWMDANRFSQRLEMSLPRARSWSYAAGEMSGVPRWTGDSDQSLFQAENVLADQNSKDRDPADEFRFTAPVGSLRTNSLGLFDMLGNVGEWLDDAPGNPDATPHETTIYRNVGGGDFQALLTRAVSEVSVVRRADWIDYATGCRVMRPLRP